MPEFTLSDLEEARRSAELCRRLCAYDTGGHAEQHRSEACYWECRERLIESLLKAQSQLLAED